jgi:TrkA domain protein
VADVDETQLPGMGVRYEFDTEAGVHLGVLVHRTGRRDLMVYSAEDPDECAQTIVLRPDDARTVAELLGASRVAEHLAKVQQQVAGLALEWIRVEEGSEYAGKTLSEAAIHSNTGVSVVALLDGDDVTPAPGADDMLASGSTIVAIGTSDGIEDLTRRLKAR